MGRFFLTQMVAVAELEAGLISVRTKAALAAAKRKGAKLGNPKLAEASASGVVSIRRNADAFAKQVLPVIRDIQQNGAQSLRAIAQALEARGIPTARGGQWTPVQVGAVLHHGS
jgi:DNA invertase Pin-like site-specific DNA recombinase